MRSDRNGAPHDSDGLFTGHLHAVSGVVLERCDDETLHPLDGGRDINGRVADERCAGCGVAMRTMVDEVFVCSFCAGDELGDGSALVVGSW